jgi:phage repressor protein C with HTH and peptisase S24 domain
MIKSMPNIRYTNTLQISAGEGSLDFEGVEPFEERDCDPLFLESCGIDNPRDAILFQVSGDSMVPRYSEGDVILVNIKKNQIVSGRVYVILLNGEFLVKQIERDKDTLKLISDNPEYKAKEMSVKDRFRVIGEVAGVWTYADSTKETACPP